MNNITLLVEFNMIVGEDVYPSNMTVCVPLENVKRVKDIEILVEDFLNNIISSDTEVTNIEYL